MTIKKLWTYFNVILPYLISYICAMLACSLWITGINGWLAILVSVLIMTPSIITRFWMLSQYRLEEVTRPLPVKAAVDVLEDEGTDELPLEEIFEEPLPLEDTTPIVSDTERVCISIFINGKKAHAFSMASDSRILDDNDGLYQHAIKYPQVAKLIKNDPVRYKTHCQYRSGWERAIYLTTESSRPDPNISIVI